VNAEGGAVTATLVRPDEPAQAENRGGRDRFRLARSASVRGVGSTDALLAARLEAGDDRALAEAIDALGAPVYATALRVLRDASTAQDVVQDVFVDLWCHPGRFDETHGSLRAYLTVCARHRAQDVLRGAARRADREVRYERTTSLPVPASPLDEATAAETSAAVHAAVRRLPPDQREAVELAYFGGLSYRDVALVLGVPEGTAKSRVRLALAKLGALLDRRMLDP
jgi:RNA polymerase sigma-70 factor (ECF subfamily)